MAFDTHHYIDVAGERVVVQDPHTLRYYATGECKKQMRQRWSRHEWKNHGGAAHAVVTTIF